MSQINPQRTITFIEPPPVTAFTAYIYAPTRIKRKRPKKLTALKNQQFCDTFQLHFFNDSHCMQDSNSVTTHTTNKREKNYGNLKKSRGLLEKFSPQTSTTDYKKPAALTGLQEKNPSKSPITNFTLHIQKPIRSNLFAVSDSSAATIDDVPATHFSFIS